jgi:hypothetical protein
MNVRRLIDIAEVERLTKLALEAAGQHAVPVQVLEADEGRLVAINGGEVLIGETETPSPHGRTWLPAWEVEKSVRPEEVRWVPDPDDTTMVGVYVDVNKAVAIAALTYVNRRISDALEAA